MQAQQYVRRVSAAHGRDGARPEGATDDRRVGEQVLAIGGEQVEAGGDEGADRARHGQPGARPEDERPCSSVDEQVAVLQQADELLREQGVAPAPLEQPCLKAYRQRPRTQTSQDQPAGLVAAERAERYAIGRSDEAGARSFSIEHLPTRSGHEQERRAAQHLRQVVEEREHRLVSPVQVLDDQHGGPL